MALDEDLRIYVAHHRKQGYALGVDDCATFVCDWIFLQRKIDVRSLIQGTYDNDEMGAIQISLMQQIASRVDFKDTSNPRVGDVGLFVPKIYSGVVAIGICGGSKWFGRTPNGMMVSRNPVVVSAWGIFPQ